MRLTDYLLNHSRRCSPLKFWLRGHVRK